ncbi:MAG: hypothetical protein DWG76_00370 [Chloroflexi bacterium]|nr:hypothetical protein [Chloroflexota bacterium]
MSNSTIGWVILVGCVLFLSAAFNPSAMAFGVQGAQAKLEVINRNSSLWVLSQYGFGLGAVVTAFGFVLLARAQGNALAGTVSYGMLVGALLWGINLFTRATDFAGFANGTQPTWPFLTYTFLTMLGLAVWGWFYLQGGFPIWLGWATLLPTLILFVLLAVFKDMPPFVYYLISLMTAWVLLKK